MKYVLIAVVFCLCVFVGYVISGRYNKRKNFYSSLVALANKLALEINFSRERLKVLLENFDESHKKHLLDVDKHFIDYLDKKSELTIENLFKNANILKPAEKDFVLLFFKTLGRSDVENQTKEIQAFESQFNDIKSRCEAEQKKYGSLSLKLGVVAGLFFAVIMF